MLSSWMAAAVVVVVQRARRPLAIRNGVTYQPAYLPTYLPTHLAAWLPLFQFWSRKLRPGGRPTDGRWRTRELARQQVSAPVAAKGKEQAKDG